jgi:uncharacterized protein
VTIQTHIELMETLAAVDGELSTLNEELTRERTSLHGKKTQLQELESKLARETQGSDEMDKMRGDLIGELRQMALQVERSREKLARCRTEREANAAQREVEELRKLYRDREIEIEKLGGLMEQARSEVDKTGAERSGIVAELDQNEGPVSARIAELEREVATRDATRQEIVAKVPPALYRKYELVRKRRGTALAHTTDGTCSQCHMQIPPMLFQQIRRAQEFSQCPSCNRILYFRAEAAALADSPTSGA